ncbi:hypothetical protein GRF29_19g1717001 [Pseudopithomyces chartarum]|uniref:Uncharacterized protein n=1 Tax=Pseudopithomyces chartarum TaxID=1892770 RepID=A0AAN6M6D4_9PLEO|nr:hypothetical protein GRF29_19g1717001 [Pseudopithomyces chartarum]
MPTPNATGDDFAGSDEGNAEFPVTVAGAAPPPDSVALADAASSPDTVAVAAALTLPAVDSPTDTTTALLTTTSLAHPSLAVVYAFPASPSPSPNANPLLSQHVVFTPNVFPYSLVLPVPQHHWPSPGH